MYGSADDVSHLSFIASGSMRTITDSDIGGDAKHVHGYPLVWIAQITHSTSPSLSKDSLIAPASSSSSSSSNARKASGNVEAKVRAVTKLLSISKLRLTATAVRGNSDVPIAGRILADVILFSSTPDLTPNTSFNNTASTFPIAPLAAPH